MTVNIDQWMQYSLKLAKKALDLNEVPVGACIVLDDICLGFGFNQPIKTNDPCAHAEIIAIRQAAEKIGNYRLLNTTLIVTLEPCLMCLGAMINARITKLVYAAEDPLKGIISTNKHLELFEKLNHSFVIESGFNKKAASDLLQDFFKSKR